MTPIAITAVLLALMVPGVLYIWIAIRTRDEVKSITQFLPLERHLRSGSVTATVVAAGISMATVMVALINLAPLLGGALFATVITYALGFLLLSFGVTRIIDRNPQGLILHAFLGDAYESTAVRNTATVFTIIGYLSIFSMELLVSVELLRPFFGEWILSFAVVYLGFLLIYTTMCGFRGVVATDRWQLLFIFVALGSLGAFVILMGFREAPSSSFLLHAYTLVNSWSAPVAFFIGVAFMNIPAPFSDAGTWQRLCAATDTRQARSGLQRACVLFVVIWGILIASGIFLSGSTTVLQHWNSESESLMTAVLKSLGSGSPTGTCLLFLLVLGLFSAMISTADSLLIAAAQVTMTGFRRHEALLLQPTTALRQARWLVAMLAIGAFAVFIVFHLIGLNIVQLVFAIYGAQLALFPTTAAALFLPRSFGIQRLRYAALASIAGGFTAAWTIAIWGHTTGSLDLQFYAPAAGLGVATVALLVGLLLDGIARRSGVDPHG